MTDSPAALKQKLRPKRLRKRRAGGSGEDFPLRVAKVMRVDSKRMTVSLYCLTGAGDTYENVALTFPNAGARHFLGAIPDVNDLCVLGYSPSESGSSRQPYIVGWLVPGVNAGYDWTMTSPTKENEVNLTPALREALSGTFGRRRHKLRQLNAGNVGASSSQGSDLKLSESVLLSNRRGNEILLRDQDQAIVSRSLQRFHAGAGVRTYSGMVQRDSALLPTQMIGDSVDWNSNKQVDAEGVAIPSSEIGSSIDSAMLRANPVFEAGLQMGYTDPADTLRRGLYIDESGMVYDRLVQPSATYGGKPLYRVSVDQDLRGNPRNGVLADDAEVFSEYRVEVAHTSDGTLPVTEQTDGIDIDRLLPNAPTAGVDGSGDVNPMNRSPNGAMVELVLGTAIGNDHINERDSYGKPLVASLYDKNGRLDPGVRAAGPTTPITDHSAFLVRVHNPTDPKAPSAFMAITKGGAFRSYFPGAGSESHQEYYQTGKRVSLGRNSDGTSYVVEAKGTVALKSVGKGRASDNVGVDLSSEGGAVSLFGGGATTEGGGTPTSSSESNSTPAGSRYAVMIQSAKSLLMSATETIRLSGQEVRVENADSILVSANSAVSLVSGDRVSISTKVLSTTVSGKAEYTFGGPKNSLPTNGPSRTLSFTATPLTGGLGGVVDELKYVFGGRKTTFRIGRQDTTLNIGSYNVNSMSSAPITFGQGSGVHLRTGLPGIDNRLDLGLFSATLTSNFGSASVSSTKGPASLKGATTALVRGTARVTLSGLTVRVNTPTPFQGAVITDGCLNPITGRSHRLSGSLGVPTFTVGF
jgi:hypothetical protein